VVFPISNGRVGLIASKIIILATYLGSWALVSLVIVSIFLLEAIGASKLGSFPLQAHLRSMRELIPLRAITCVLPFKHLAKKVQIVFRKVFQRDYTTILLLASFSLTF